MCRRYGLQQPLTLIVRRCVLFIINFFAAIDALLNNEENKPNMIGVPL